jgi:hypothetical protein
MTGHPCISCIAFSAMPMPNIDLAAYDVSSNSNSLVCVCECVCVCVQDAGEDDWMSRYFFTGSIMPSIDYI